MSNLQTGLVAALPYVVGTIGMVWYGRRSDRTMERKGHAAVALAIAAIGIGGSGLLADPILKMAALCVGTFGVFAVLPVFWTLPTAFLSGAAAAAGIAVINSIGNLAGFAGPFVMGWLKDATGSFSAGLLVIAGVAVVGVLVVLVMPHEAALEKSADAEAHASGVGLQRSRATRPGGLEEASLVAGGVHGLVNEGQLLDRRRRQDERVEVGRAHAAVHAVHGEAHRQPGVDDPAEIARLVRVEVDLGGQLTLADRRAG